MSIDRKINHYSLNNPASIYNEEALTSLELSARTAGLVNECVDNFNELETNTHNHLDEQDEAINTMLTKTMPAKVVSEVTKHITNGDFDKSIDKYAGNLNERLDTLLGSVVEGSTTADAELIDIRTGTRGEHYPNAGTSVRKQIEKIDLTSPRGVLPSNATIIPDKIYITGEERTLAGYSTISIPVELNDIIVIKDGHNDYFSGLSFSYIVQGIKSDGAVYNDANLGNALCMNTDATRNGVVLPNNSANAIETLLIAIKSEYIANISVITKSNIGTYNGCLDIGKVPSEILTLADLPLAKNIINDERLIGNSAIGALTNDLNEIRFNLYRDVLIYGPYFVPAGSIINMTYDGALGTIGCVCDKDFKYKDILAAKKYPSTYPVTEDSYVFLMTSTLDVPHTEVVITNETKVGIIPKYLVEGDSARLHGKKWVSLGDSITARETWQSYVVNELGLVHTNCGIGSTCLSGTSATAFWQDARLDAVKEADPDIVTILGGANDLVTVGVIGYESDLVSKNTNTFIGAYSYIIDNLLSWKPSLEIMILATTWAHDNGAEFTDNVTYGDYASACERVAKWYGIPYVDLYHNAGFNQYTLGDGVNAVYSSDHIHPNSAGGKKIASLVIAKIKECYS